MARAPFGPLGDALTLKRLGGDKNSYGQIRMWGSIVYFIAAFAAGALRTTYPHAPLWMGCGLIVLAIWFCWTLPSEEFRIPKPPKGILKPLLRSPLIWLFLFLATLHGITITTYDNFFSLHIEKLGLSPSVTGMAIATGVIAEVVVLALGKPLLQRFGAVWLILVGVASSCPRFLCTGYVTAPIALILWQSLHGLGFGGILDWRCSVFESCCATRCTQCGTIPSPRKYIRCRIPLFAGAGIRRLSMDRPRHAVSSARLGKHPYDRRTVLFLKQAKAQYRSLVVSTIPNGLAVCTHADTRPRYRDLWRFLLDDAQCRLFLVGWKNVIKSHTFRIFNGFVIHIVAE